MPTIIKNPLKDNSVPLGDGTNTDKQLQFDVSSPNNPYLKYDANSTNLKYSNTGLASDEVTLDEYGTFVHTQSSPASIWTITHNLGRFPAITVVDSANSVVDGDILYITENQLTLTFVGAFSGKAYLN